MGGEGHLDLVSSGHAATHSAQPAEMKPAQRGKVRDMPDTRAARLGAALATVALAVTYAVSAAAPPAPASRRDGHVGDFDGDGRADVYWAVPGPAPDVMAFSEPDGSFATEAIPLDGTYQPLVGDFDGDGADDVVHYRPGAGATFAWFGGRDRGMTRVGMRALGAYRPAVGDFDGDKRSDLLWFAPGGRDQVWYGTANRRFTAVDVSATTDATPVTGDLDGDCRSDVLWHARSGPTRVWYGSATRGRFTPETREAGLPTRPALGDFDGDGTTDVFWYGPGGAADFVDLSTRLRTYRRVSFSLGGSYRAAAGDFNGDRFGDVFLSADGKAADTVWYGTPAGVFTPSSVSSSSAVQPLVGDFAAAGRSALYFPDREEVWQGGTLRDFAVRHVALRTNLVDALRPEVWQQRYNPYGYVAHALGEIDGHGYTNSLEAFKSSYAKGFRVFEADFLLLGDRTILAAHDRTESWFGLTKPFRETTREDMAGRKIVGKYTPLDGVAVIELMRRYRDMYLILDVKCCSVEIVTRMIARAADPQVQRRLLPHIEGQADLDGIRRYYPLQNYVVALYRTQWAGHFDDPAVLSFVRRNRAPAVMMWWHTRDPNKSLARNAAENRRYTTTFATSLQQAGAVVYVHSLDDTKAMKEFERRGVGVYSNGPFAPLV
jgi:hypothetical protein